MENNLQAQWNEYQRMLQEDPLKGGAIAFAAGLLLSLFPIGRLLGLVFRLVLFAIKPALLVLGAVKAYEYAQRYGNSPDR